jgi:hypothetical protein
MVPDSKHEIGMELNYVLFFPSKKIWFQIPSFIVPLPPILLGARADDCEVQEPPAKKIKVEKYDGEDLSKLPKQPLAKHILVTSYC